MTLRDGVGAAEADVVGPVEPGVSLWSAHWPDGNALDYLVVPGNVGDDDLLARLVDAVTGSAACRRRFARSSRSVARPGRRWGRSPATT